MKNVRIDLGVRNYDIHSGKGRLEEIKALLDVMSHDKKSRNGKVSFVLPAERGKMLEYLLDKEEIRW